MGHVPDLGLRSNTARPNRHRVAPAGVSSRRDSYDRSWRHPAAVGRDARGRRGTRSRRDPRRLRRAGAGGRRGGAGQRGRRRRGGRGAGRRGPCPERRRLGAAGHPQRLVHASRTHPVGARRAVRAPGRRTPLAGARGPGLCRRRAVARAPQLGPGRRAGPARGRRRRRRARRRPHALRAPRRGLGADRMIAAVIIVLLALVAAALALVAASVRVLREYERGVVFRLGRVTEHRGPGLIFLVPAVDRMVRVSLRTVTLKVPVQEVITRDNVPARVTAVAYYRIVDPTRSVTEIENVVAATSQIAQTTLRSVLGKAELDALLAGAERLNDHLQQIIDDQTEPWGVKVTTVEIKDVEIPDRMQHAIARQAEAERERRAKVINAEAEFQAAARLSDAADVIGRNSVTIQLRALQTLIEVSSSPSSTIVFPVPMSLLQAGDGAAPTATTQEAIEAAKAVLEAGVAARERSTT